ncbi:MAG: type II toxin-antitoxin system RelE/ParE family toxin [Planctomycetes bacterium]|nr:type II toxin-antitoxin system RelE/ParE family toxin [Planctomycetota bacterium]
MSEYRLSDQAVDDLDEIWDYVAVKCDNAPVARRLLAAISAKCSFLAENPRVGLAREDLLPGLRLFPCGNYAIGFRVINDGVEIVRVVDGRRDLSALF